MKILILGSGGREHALAWKLSHADSNRVVICAPGNPGCAQIGPCYTPADSSPAAILNLAERLGVDVTVVGPEAPLVAGVVDHFTSHGQTIIGPTRAAAQLEGSKLFTKAFLERHAIPTAKAVKCASRPEAADALHSFPAPLVLKTDGLAAGKGVIIAQTSAEARAGLATLPEAPLLVEEFLVGEEVSFIAYVRNGRAIPLAPSQDHKTIYDGDQGPNTGGMGAYCDSRILTPAQTQEVLDTIIEPTVRGMEREGNPYSGFLYAGLMMTADGPRVLEYNARLGDPETQAILHKMVSDFLATLIDGTEPKWRAEPSVCIVLAAHGYPGTVRTGDPIAGLDAVQCEVFHAGTKNAGGQIATNGGRVFGVTNRGATLAEAIANTYREAHKIHFDGMQMRSDIGAKGLKRW